MAVSLFDEDGVDRENFCILRGPFLEDTGTDKVASGDNIKIWLFLFCIIDHLHIYAQTNQN